MTVSTSITESESLQTKTRRSSYSNVEKIVIGRIHFTRAKKQSGRLMTIPNCSLISSSVTDYDEHSDSR